jgi:hypothetical protein
VAIRCISQEVADEETLRSSSAPAQLPLHVRGGKAQLPEGKEDPMTRPQGRWQVRADESNLTPAQYSRLELLPDDFHVVGWDSAWSTPHLAGPLIEDPLDHHLCRLSPGGKLFNNPSPEALEALARRRERLALQ